MSEVVRSQEQVLVRIGIDYVSSIVHLCAPASGVSRGTVFCFHGFMGNAGDFGALTELLAANGFTAIAPDAIGRGASGRFPRPRQYGFRNTMQGAVAAYSKFRSQRNYAVSLGWGGLVAIMAAEATTTRLGKLVLTDLPLTYRVSNDYSILDAVKVAGTVYPTLEDATAALLNCGEFDGYPRAELGRLSHRLKAVDGGFAFNVDASIAARADDYGSREFHIDQILGDVADRSLLMGSPDDLAVPGGKQPDKLVFHKRTNVGPIWSQDELLLTLGFLVDASSG